MKFLSILLIIQFILFSVFFEKGGAEFDSLSNNCEQARNIPYDYALYPGYGYYKYHRIPVMWPDARDICNKEGGHLAIPNSPQELDLIVKIFNIYPRTKLSPHPEIIHIGVTNIFSQNREFVTLKGEPWNRDYIKWAPGEPTVYPNEHCGCITSSKTFLDCYCFEILHFICEIDI